MRWSDSWQETEAVPGLDAGETGFAKAPMLFGHYVDEDGDGFQVVGLSRGYTISIEEQGGSPYWASDATEHFGGNGYTF